MAPLNQAPYSKTLLQKAKIYGTDTSEKQKRRKQKGSASRGDDHSQGSSDQGTRNSSNNKPLHHRLNPPPPGLSKSLGMNAFGIKVAMNNIGR
ncbi:hypothetical protein TrLO_g13789 [Triparma laevis f. longispina]|uniref:Uncharacterized protein n=1 Tax=Triparma laevis f. longispina TaxID=1714387 RepID=A0A9W7FED7_9STRA|nr:hypothetical protein TrLO_g13789 [Triparma laevis f. longispina]